MDNAPLIETPAPDPIPVPAEPAQKTLTVEKLRQRLNATCQQIEMTKAQLAALSGSRSTLETLIKDLTDGN
jgi:hypothetical protein